MKHRLISLTSLASALVLAFASPASAANVARTDPLGDQLRLAGWSQAGTALRNMSDTRGYDLWTTTTKRLSVRFRMREVVPGAAWRYQHFYSVGVVGRTNLQFQVTQLDSQWSAYVQSPAGPLCPSSVTRSVNYDANSVTVSIPISCLPPGSHYANVSVTGKSGLVSNGSIKPVGEDERTQLATLRIR